MLLVDDDATLLDVLATLFELERFAVHTAADGATALERIAQRRPDVVVCDVAMPGVDGLEVCRRVKGDPATAELPVILLTAHGGHQAHAAGEAAGCDAYLVKPFSPLELVELVRQLGDGTAGQGALR